MQSIRGGGFWILLGVVVGGLALVFQGDPGGHGELASREPGDASTERPREEQAPQIETSREAPSPAGAGDKDASSSEFREFGTGLLVELVSGASPVGREQVFRELRRRHVIYPLEVGHLLTLATLRADPARRDDVRAIGDWARRIIESHKNRERLVEPILALALRDGERTQSALLDVLDDLGRMRPSDVGAARAAFLDERATYRLKRSILLLLPSVAEHALPMVLPLALFRHEVVSGKAQADAMRPDASGKKGPGGGPITLPHPGSHHRAGGYQREHLEVQIDALLEQIGAPALQELVRAYRKYPPHPDPRFRARSGWTVYDDAIVATAHLDVEVVLAMSVSKNSRERRLAAQALRDLEVKSPDVERALRTLREDPDRLVREFAKRS